MKFSSKEILGILFVEILVLIFYFKVLGGFFQQDEWLSFSYNLYLSKEGIIRTILIAFSPTVGHYQPLNTLLINFLVNFFKVNYLPFALFSVFLHMLNVAAVFYLGKIFFKRISLAIFISLLFGLIATSYQATSWVMADVGVHLSSFFALLSIIFIIKFCNEIDQKFFYLSVIFLIIAVLFKESVIGVFVILPIAIFFFSNEKYNKKLKLSSFIALIAFIYLFIRVTMIFLPQTITKDVLVTKSQSSQNLIYNLSTFPIKGFVQSIFPQKIILDISYFFADRIFSTSSERKQSVEYNTFIQNRFTEVVNLVLFVILIIICLSAYRKAEDIASKKILLFSLSLVIFNSPIFALTPEKSGVINFIDSRNLYFICVGSSLIIILVLKLITNVNKLFVLTLLIIVLINIYWLNRQLDFFLVQGTIRKNILSQIKKESPKLSNKVIFYTESDSSFYGLSDEERILPFQSGFGQTLLVWLNEKGNFPKEFYQNKFLWGLTEQGYQEFAGRGFGYFRIFSDLATTIANKKIPLDSIFAFSYSAQNNDLKNITDEVKGRVLGFEAKKIEISHRDLQVRASTNSKDSYLAIDGDRTSFWDSKLAYKNSQYFDIGLSTPRKVAQVTIDKYNDPNQNQVGFRVLLSNDNKLWRQFFYSKRYLPDKSGFINLFFKPQFAQYIRIEQIGYHCCADWIINELNVYEAIE